MAERRYGPINGAGTVIIEKDAEKQIDKGSLGTTVYMGVMEKGPVGKLFKCGTRKEYEAKAGSFIPESFVPDSAFDFYSMGRAAGDLFCLRVTDGTEVQSELTLYGRKNTGVEKLLSDDCSGQYLFVSAADYLALGSPKISSLLTLNSEALGSSAVLQVTGVDLDTPAVGTVRLTVNATVAYLTGDTVIAYSGAVSPEVAKFKAANGGRWGGKKDILFSTAFGVGGLAAFSFDTGKTMLEDYFVGALLRFSAMPGKSYTVVANDTAGVLYVSADSVMDEDYTSSGSSDETWSVQLLNNDKSLAVKVLDGVSYPSTRFGLEIYVDGIRVLQYNDLSLDPTSDSYYQDFINDDDSNVYVEITDLWYGAYTPDVRPANLFGQNFAITNTELTGRAVSPTFGGTGNGVIDAFTYGGSVQEDTIDVECVSAGAQAEGSIQITNNTLGTSKAELVGGVLTGAYALGDFTASPHVKMFVNLYGQGNVEVTVPIASMTDGIASPVALQGAINNALTAAGHVGVVGVGWDSNKFEFETEARGKGLTLKFLDTGEPGGSFASEVLITDALASYQLDGDGDYIRISFDSGSSYHDLRFVTGYHPGGEGVVFVGIDAPATATAIKTTIDNFAVLAAMLDTTLATDTVILTSKAPKDQVGWSITEVDGGVDNITIIDFAGGSDQEWSYTSAALGLLAGVTPVTATPFVAPNDFGIGFTINSGATFYSLGDKFTLVLRPWEANAMVGGWLFPDVLNAPRSKYKILANTANTITVKPTSDMLAYAKLGSTYRVEYVQELAGGYDGLVNIADTDYLSQLDPATSPINSLFGEKKGLVKIGIPGVTSTAVQKAGIEYADARNYQFRVQVPSNVVSEESAEAYVNDTIGRNDFAVVSFPSWMYIPHPTASGLKLVPNMGAIHGREALWAKNYGGYHKAASGIDVTIPNCVKLPTGDKVLDEELLNKHGIGVVKSKNGNFIIWGDRTLSIDPAWKWKHQREMMSYYENDLRESFDWIVFAINDKVEQKKALSALRSYFIPEYKKRALRGDTFEDAVQLKLDDENNTNLTMANGDMNAEIGLRLADTVERFVITMSKLGIFD